MSRWEPLTRQEIDKIMHDAEANVAKLEAERLETVKKHLEKERQGFDQAVMASKFTEQLEAERRARQEAEAQAAAMRSALGLTVEAYQGVGDFEGTGQNMAGIIGFIEDALSTDTGKQYLAIVEAARRWEAAWDALGTHREPCQASRKYLCPTCSELSQAASEADNELIKAVLALKGGDSQ